MDGIVKMVNAEKGWGFITGRDKKDYFFHRKHMERGTSIDNIQQGDTVEFEGADGPKGLYAENVSLA